MRENCVDWRACSRKLTYVLGILFHWILWKFLLFNCLGLMCILLYTHAWSRTNSSISKQMVNNRNNSDFSKFQPIFWCQNVPFSLPRDSFGEKIRTSFWIFVITRSLVVLREFRLSKFTMHSQRNSRNSFLREWKKRLLHLRQNNWKTRRVDTLFVFIFQRLQKFSST